MRNTVLCAMVMVWGLGCGGFGPVFEQEAGTEEAASPETGSAETGPAETGPAEAGLEEDAAATCARFGESCLDLPCCSVADFAVACVQWRCVDPSDIDAGAGDAGDADAPACVPTLGFTNYTAQVEATACGHPGICTGICWDSLCSGSVASSACADCLTSHCGSAWPSVEGVD